MKFPENPKEGVNFFLLLLEALDILSGDNTEKYGYFGFLQNKKETCQRHVKWQLGVWGAL